MRNEEECRRNRLPKKIIYTKRKKNTQHTPATTTTFNSDYFFLIRIKYLTELQHKEVCVLMSINVR
jgi:hypothetical protein